MIQERQVTARTLHQYHNRLCRHQSTTPRASIAKPMFYVCLDDMHFKGKLARPKPATNFPRQYQSTGGVLMRLAVVGSSKSPLRRSLGIYGVTQPHRLQSSSKACCKAKKIIAVLVLYIDRIFPFRSCFQGEGKTGSRDTSIYLGQSTRIPTVRRSMWLCQPTAHTLYFDVPSVRVTLCLCVHINVIDAYI